MITVRPTLKSDADILCELQKAAFLPIYEQQEAEPGLVLVAYEKDVAPLDD